jgi:hypothetical protein
MVDAGWQGDWGVRAWGPRSHGCFGLNFGSCKCYSPTFKRRGGARLRPCSVPTRRFWTLHFYNLKSTQIKMGPITLMPQ